MRARLHLIHLIFLLLLPILVAAFGLSVWTAIVLVSVALVWRWAIVMTGLRRAAQGPALTLDSISASHFVEKVRWCLDRLGVDYAEQASGGTLGVFFTGRTVPRLRLRTGIVETSIGNSPEILRFLWGNYSSSHAADFLEPRPERLDFEKTLDRYARDLQIWIYWHLRGERLLTLRAWGANCQHTPPAHRVALKLLYPLLTRLIGRAFGLSHDAYARARERIEALLNEVEAKLADGRRAILDKETRSFTDYTFAAYTGLWLQPAGYGGGRAGACRLERDTLPLAMQQDIERWSEDFPRSVGFAEALYASERQTGQN